MQDEPGCCSITSVYVSHSLILHRGTLWQGPRACSLPFGCYHSQWIRELKTEEGGKKGAFFCCAQTLLKTSFPNFRFDHNSVFFIRFWRLSDATNPYSAACIQIQFCDEKLCSPPILEDLRLLIYFVLHLCMKLSNLILYWLPLMHIRNLSKDMTL